MPVSHPLFKSFTGFLTVVFVWTSCIIPQNAQAQTVSAPGVARPLGQTFTPALIKGLRIDAQNAFQFEFLIDAGDAVGAGSKPALTQGRVTNPPLHDESLKLIKYFLASLTLPEKDLWVNLSPYEHDRIIPDAFGQTEMGRDLLEQDYILKQLTASLMSPENEEGKKFWEKVYERVYNNVGAYCNTPLQNNDGQCMQDAIESFNKVWIVPETGYFYEHNNTVFIADAKLKVMLEEDYLGNGGRGMVDKNKPSTNHQSPTTDIKSLIRQTILPLIEDEINNGASFANLRQIYNAQLLAVWFKKRLKDHILGQVYADKKNIESLSLRDEAEAIADIESIWQKYVAAFQSGASNIIQDEYDPVTQTIVPRKYFTGGATPVKKVDFASLNQAEAIAAGFTELAFVTVSIGDPAMLENNRKGVVDFILKQIDYGIDKSDLNLLSEEALNYAADEMKRGNVPLAVRYLEDAARRKETQLKNGANSFENGINPYVPNIKTSCTNVRKLELQDIVHFY